MRLIACLWRVILVSMLGLAQPILAQSTAASAKAPAAVAAAEPAVLKGTAAYRLGSGDKVRVTVYNEDTLSGEYVVDGTGNLSIQLVGTIPAVGRTVPDVIAAITNRLKDGGFMLNPSVAVEVLNYRPFYVLGEIKDPGKYAYVSGMSVLNAVALAGGYTYRARKDKVMIIHADDAERKEREAGPNDEVLPGDILRILERFF